MNRRKKNSYRAAYTTKVASQWTCLSVGQCHHIRSTTLTGEGDGLRRPCTLRERERGLAMEPAFEVVPGSLGMALAMGAMAAAVPRCSWDGGGGGGRGAGPLPVTLSSWASAGYGWVKLGIPLITPWEAPA